MSSEVSAGGTIAETICMKLIRRNEEDDDDDDVMLTGDVAGGILKSMKDPNVSPNHVMANDILNDILETAMDIAIGGESETSPLTKNILDESDNSELKNIIDGLSKISVDKSNKGLAIDGEMKLLLSGIMAASQSPPKNLGIGDSPPMNNYEELEPVMIKPSKIVEKKSRITDLVMNSKKALNNLLNEEQRKKQDEWEELNEHVIQVIELQEEPFVKEPLSPESYPLPIDEDEDMLLMTKTNEDTLDAIELSNEVTTKCGEGDEKNLDEKNQSAANNVSKKSSLCSSAKKKKWNFSFKFFNFRKNRNNDKKQVEAEASNTTSD